MEMMERIRMQVPKRRKKRIILPSIKGLVVHLESKPLGDPISSISNYKSGKNLPRRKEQSVNLVMLFKESRQL